MGECDIGGNVGAKNSLDHNYLAVAEQYGATVGMRTEVVFVAQADEGYRVRLREYGRAGAGRHGTERDVTRSGSLSGEKSARNKPPFPEHSLHAFQISTRHVGSVGLG